MSDSITDLLKLVLVCPRRAPAGQSSTRLDRLFADLASDRPSRKPHEIEDEIWALWTNHRDEAMAERMGHAIAGIARKQHAQAEALLDALVEDQPDWAEVWNKRATLYYILGRHEESMADIAHTLALEPRHFGAICGFAQICLARGRQVEALAAFETALAVHPHLENVRAAVEALGKTSGSRLN